MDKLRTLSIAAAVSLALAACAQNQSTPDDTSGSQSSTASTPPSSTSSDTSTASTTPDSSASSTSESGTMSADSSTSESGATPPADPSMGAGAAAPVVIGLQVETPTGEPLGTVVEIVADAATGQPLFAVITAADETTAVPYSAATSMVQDDALVMDRSRLEAAPHLEQGEWRDQSRGTWANEANSYWGQGETRTATPGTEEDPSSRNR